MEEVKPKVVFAESIEGRQNQYLRRGNGEAHQAGYGVRHRAEPFL